MAAAVTMWANMASWLTPTILFCFLNLMIITIFLTSHLKSHNPKPPQDQHNPEPPHLARAPSILDRVRSIDFSLYRSDQPDPLHNPPQLVRRAPSILDRVKSIDFSLYRSDQPDPSHNPSQLVRAPSIIDRDRSNFSFYNSKQPETLQVDPTHEEPHHHVTFSARLVRTPSMLERVMTKFLLYRSEQPDPFRPETHRVDPTHEEAHHVTRSMSENAPAREAPAARMRKSASEKLRAEEKAASAEEVDRRRPATTREKEQTASLGEDEEGVDGKADDFITMFKQQLKLQRVESNLRYREMVNRGSGEWREG